LKRFHTVGLRLDVQGVNVALNTAINFALKPQSNSHEEINWVSIRSKTEYAYTEICSMIRTQYTARVFHPLLNKITKQTSDEIEIKANSSSARKDYKRDDHRYNGEISHQIE